MEAGREKKVASSVSLAVSWREKKFGTGEKMHTKQRKEFLPFRWMVARVETASSLEKKYEERTENAIHGTRLDPTLTKKIYQLPVFCERESWIFGVLLIFSLQGVFPRTIRLTMRPQCLYQIVFKDCRFLGA